MDDYDVRERNYSVSVLIGGGALVAVLAAIVTAVVLVSQSSSDAVYRRPPVAVPAAHTTAYAHPASSVAPAPDVEGLQVFNEMPRLPVLGELLSP